MKKDKIIGMFKQKTICNIVIAWPLRNSSMRQKIEREKPLIPWHKWRKKNKQEMILQIASCDALMNKVEKKTEPKTRDTLMSNQEKKDRIADFSSW